MLNDARLGVLASGIRGPKQPRLEVLTPARWS